MDFRDKSNCSLGKGADLRRALEWERAVTTIYRKVCVRTYVLSTCSIPYGSTKHCSNSIGASACKCSVKFLYHKKRQFIANTMEVQVIFNFHNVTTVILLFTPVGVFSNYDWLVRNAGFWLVEKHNFHFASLIRARTL